MENKYLLRWIRIPVLVGTVLSVQLGVAADRTAAQALSEYQNLRQSTAIERLSLLGEARQRGLERNKGHVRDLLAMLKRSQTEEESAALIGLLQGQYKIGDQDEVNTEIAQALKTYANSPVKRVAAAATFAYSRLGYFLDTEDVLLAALNRRVFDNNDYFGELAHVGWLAEPRAASAIFERIGRSKNRYALQILASTFQEGSSALKIDRAALTAAREALLKAPPKFNPAVGEFSIADSLEYTDWLFAVAQLNSRVDGTAVATTLTEHIPQMSGKKILALMITDEGRAYAKEFSPSTIAQMRTEVDQLLMHQPYPRNQDVSRIANEVLSYLVP
ncbi:hypothetical protein [Massilia endophytica]|uniref:hypothetical protein n=1 Tax=Massilia endophytica TaxID=2899220 RepID=UPI001E517F4E|nr:hypothetical protein [Massilia endophytica]UGQ47058.1 hypothetical protein LSQ66_00855 [Massilia endophytica]